MNDWYRVVVIVVAHCGLVRVPANYFSPGYVAFEAMAGAAFDSFTRFVVLGSREHAGRPDGTKPATRS